MDVRGLSFQTRERLFLLALAVSLGAPFIPFGGGSLYGWMSQYTLDTIGAYETGYVQTFLLCWLICLMPLVLWSLVGAALSRLRTLDELRAVFRIGMTLSEFLAACDELNIGRPAAEKNPISIFVKEGDAVVFTFANGVLTHAEYQGRPLLK